MFFCQKTGTIHERNAEDVRFPDELPHSEPAGKSRSMGWEAESLQRGTYACLAF